MQLLYGNDGTNYRIISKSKELTKQSEQLLLEYYLKYDFATKEYYSNIKNEPKAITYLTSNLNNTIKDSIIVSKVGRMTNVGSPSYYYHVYINEVDDSFYKEDFFEIFNYIFIDDNNISNLHDNMIDGYQFNHNNTHNIYLNKTQIISIIASFMSNESRGKRTNIIVDNVGDNYNQRSKEILMTIYNYLPYQLRKRYGFISYCRDDKNIGARISFVLYPKNEMRDLEEYINIEDLKLSRVNQKYIDYASYLVNITDEERENHFDKLSNLVYRNRLSIEDCIIYYTSVTKWNNGNQEELLGEWIDYVDKASLTNTPLYNQLLEIIKKKVDSKYYNDYLLNILNLEDLHNMTYLAIKAIRFSDYIGIKLDSNRIKELYYNKLNSSSIEDKANIYKQELNYLQELNISSSNFDNIKNDIIKEITIEYNNISDSYNNELEEEYNYITKQFNDHYNDNYKEMENFINTLKSNIKYLDNQEIISSNVIEWLDKKILSISLKELSDLLSLINSLNIDINKYINNIENITVDLSNMQSILDNYNIIPNLDINIDLNIHIINDYKLNIKEILKIINFIIFNKEYSNIVILLEIMDLGILNSNHIELLIKNSKNINDILKIIDYYYISNNQLSGIYLYKLLKKYHEDMLSMVVDNISNSNEELSIFIKLVGKKKKNHFFKK